VLGPAGVSRAAGFVEGARPGRGSTARLALVVRVPSVIVLSVLSALVLLASADAARRPARPAEAQGVFAAIQRHAPTMPIACLPLRVRVSTTNSSYASAAVSRTLSSCTWGDGEYLLRRVGTRWRVLAEGSEHACSEAPRAVLRDLFGGCV
jgi:hypothetical protein